MLGVKGEHALLRALAFSPAFRRRFADPVKSRDRLSVKDLPACWREASLMGVLSWIRDQSANGVREQIREKSPCFLLCKLSSFQPVRLWRTYRLNEHPPLGGFHIPNA